MFPKKLGFANIIMSAIGVMLVVILFLTVVQPTINTAITSTSSNLTGYTGALTLANQLPLINVVVVVLAILAAGLSFWRG